MASLVKLENVALGKVSQLEFVSSKVKFMSCLISFRSLSQADPKCFCGNNSRVDCTSLKGG